MSTFPYYCALCSGPDADTYHSTPECPWRLTPFAPAPVSDNGECGAVDQKSGYRCAHEPGHLDRGVPHATISGERQWRGHPPADPALSEVAVQAADEVVACLIGHHPVEGSKYDQTVAILAAFAERVKSEAIEECAKEIRDFAAREHDLVCDARMDTGHALGHVEYLVRSILARAGSGK